MIFYSKLPLLAVSILTPILRNNIVEESIDEDFSSNAMIATDEVEDCNPPHLQQLQLLPKVPGDSELEQEIRQASQLLLMAMRGHQDKEQSGDEKLRRALLVHALSRVICAAMPDDLTEAEVCELRSSLPSKVLETYISKAQEPYVPQNRLESIVVTVVRAFFIGLQTAAPYTKQLILTLAREERKYKIMDKAVATGLSTLEVMCGSTIGRAVISGSQTVVGSVLRGVSQGMSGAMVDLNEPSKQSYARHQKVE